MPPQQSLGVLRNPKGRKERDLHSPHHSVGRRGRQAPWVERRAVPRRAPMPRLLLPSPHGPLFCFSHGQPHGSDRHQHHPDGSSAAVEGSRGRSGELRHHSHTLRRWVSAGLYSGQVGLAGVGDEYSIKIKIFCQSEAQISNFLPPRCPHIPQIVSTVGVRKLDPKGAGRARSQGQIQNQRNRPRQMDSELSQGTCPQNALRKEADPSRYVQSKRNTRVTGPCLEQMPQGNRRQGSSITRLFCCFSLHCPCPAPNAETA